MPKPILCLDFDGVIHSYTSGWEGADVISDGPVDGAMAFISAAQKHFTISIFSSRSNQPGGIEAMQTYVDRCLDMEGFEPTVYAAIVWPTVKPPAFLTIDDRAITFTGEWPDVKSLFNFRPWNKK